MYFDNLSAEEKMFVQKNLFRNNSEDYAAYYTQTNDNGVLEVGVMDFLTHTYKETYLKYKFNEFELVDVCDDKDASLGRVESMLNYNETIDSSVFNYNLAMGMVNKDYQQKALEYFKGKMQDNNLSIDANIVYEQYYYKLKDAYELLNRKISSKAKATSTKKGMFAKLFKKNSKEERPELNEDNFNL